MTKDSKSAFICDMCGGTVRINDDHVTCTCEYCGRTTNITKEMKLYLLNMEEAESHKDKIYRERIRKETEEADSRVNSYLSSKQKKSTIAWILACIVGFSVAKVSGWKLSLLIATLQLVLLVFSFLCGLQIIQFKKDRNNKYSKIMYSVATLLVIPWFIFAYMATSATMPIYGSKEIPAINAESVTNEKEGIYVFEIKDYTGLNAASFGKIDYYKHRYDSYGEGKLYIIFLTEDGEFLNPEDSAVLAQYSIVGQNIPVGTKLIHVRDRYSSNEISSSVYLQNYEEIVLVAKKIGSTSETIIKPDYIKPSYDKHEKYIKNYVGRNAASFGGLDYYKERYDSYGEGRLKIIFKSNDGAFVDPSNIDDLSHYKVISQNVPPNEKLILTYTVWSSGEESNTVKSMNYSEIILTVDRVDDSFFPEHIEIDIDNQNENNNEPNEPVEIDNTDNTENDMLITIEKGSSYAFMSDEWDVYIATAVSESIIKIEHWNKTLSSTKKLSYSKDIGSYVINEKATGFKWIDDSHLAFSIIFQDKNNSRIKNPAAHVFTININDSDQFKGTDYNKKIQCFTYQCDDWHQYRAIPLTDTLFKIECWYRSSSISDNYCFAWDWMVFDTDDNNLLFNWVDSEHSGFTIFAKDDQNKSYWKKTERVLFTIETESYKYSNISEYLARSGWDSIFD